MRFVLRCGLLCVAVGSCQTYDYTPLCADFVEQTLSRPAATPTPADILFVVDNSGSMADEQQKLADSFERMIREIAGTPDYHIAVVSTDQTSGDGERQGLNQYTWSESSPYEFSGYDSRDCENAGIAHGCFRGPSPATRMIDSSRIGVDEQIAEFRRNVLVGSCGAGIEEGLKSALIALRKDCNRGFLRAEANLVVVFVSDEDDQSIDTTVTSAVGALVALKDPSKIRVAAIVGAVDGEGHDCSIREGPACGSLCGSPPTGGSLQSCMNDRDCSDGEVCILNQCDLASLQSWSDTTCGSCAFFNAPDCCSAQAGGRYVDFARQIEARVHEADPQVALTQCRGAPSDHIACLVDTICQDNFGEALARIAKGLVIPTDYALDPPALENINVRVKVIGGRFGDAGVDLTAGADFSVNAEGTSLHLTAGERTPAPKETLLISYLTARPANDPVPAECK